jgi:hypothetical protein
MKRERVEPKSAFYDDRIIYLLLPGKETLRYPVQAMHLKQCS